MKKGKVISKSQLILAATVIILGAAVWLNVKYSATSNQNTKYLGEAQYVDKTVSSDAVPTSAKADTDYFTTAKAEREKSRKTQSEEIDETIKTAENSADALTAATELKNRLTKRIGAETNIETLLIAKGFSDVLAVISDNDINIIVRSDSDLTNEQTLQIQEIASTQGNITLDKIKILTVK